MYFVGRSYFNRAIFSPILLQVLDFYGFFSWPWGVDFSNVDEKLPSLEVSFVSFSPRKLHHHLGGINLQQTP
jgi:hypothetical protein